MFFQAKLVVFYKLQSIWTVKKNEYAFSYKIISFLKKKYILCSYKFKIDSLRQDKTHFLKQLRI